MSALLLPAVRRSRWQSCVALSADHLLTVVLAGKGFQRGLDDTTAQTKDQVECGFLQVVVRMWSEDLEGGSADLLDVVI